MPQVQDERLKSILGHLAHWNFRFQGYDENGVPLVAAPNGQIVEVNVAIRFVNDQIERNKASASTGGAEAMPQVPETPDSKPMESRIETKVESESGIEEKKDENKSSQKREPDLTVKKSAPSIVLAQPKKIKPYGDGFDPKSFDPSNIAQAESFVEKNIKKSTSSSSKWLAVQFKKFIEENRSQNTK